MQFSVKSLAVALAAAGAATATTPPGFSPAVAANLGVNFGTTSVSPPGVTLPQAVTQTVPTFSVGANSGLNGTFLVVIVDLDVPVRNGTTVTGRTTRLHELAGNFTLAQNGSLSSTTRNADAPAPYNPPSPPAESPPVPHRYVELLFAQPSGFRVPAAQVSVVQNRAGFNVAQFITAAGLAAPIRANYFQVVNTTGTATATGTSRPASTSVASATGSRPPAFTGAAVANAVGGGFAAVLAAGGAALFL